MKNNDLRVFDIKNNDINGGSTCYFICNKNAKFKTNNKKINSILKEEKKYKLESKKTFIKSSPIPINISPKYLHHFTPSI